MALAPELLEILACPRCKGGLEPRGGEGEGAPEALGCKACRLSFAVEEGIPVMLLEEAKPVVEP